MDKLSAIKAFSEVAGRRSFAEAARALGTTRSAVSKQIAALEEDLGVKLLNRTTRQVSLTDAGWTFYERVLGVLDSLKEAESSVQSLQQEPRGILRVNGPMSFGTQFLGRAVANFMSAHKDLQVQLSLTDRFIDPIEEGVDVTIRIGALDNSSLIGRKLAVAERLLVASPDYIKAHPPLIAPADLSAAHQFLHYGHGASVYRWPLIGPLGEETVPIQARLCANNGEVIRDAACNGLGIAALPLFIVAAALQDGRLVRVLPEWMPQSIPIHALYAPDKHLAAKIRLFVDFLVKNLSTNLTPSTK